MTNNVGTRKITLVLDLHWTSLLKVNHHSARGILMLVQHKVSSNTNNQPTKRGSRRWPDL